MIKMILFDIDGTLVNKHDQVLASTRQAIIAARKQGILCGVATGRGPIHLPEKVNDLGLDIFVTYNGQLVYTKEATIYAGAFDQETLKKIITFADKGHRQMMFGGQTSMEGSSMMKLAQKGRAKKMSRFIPKQFPVATFKNLLVRLHMGQNNQRYQRLNLLNKAIYQCVLFSPIEEQETLVKQLPECTITRSNPYVVDIIPKGGSKLAGIQKCLQHYDLSMDEVMVFGDNWNDAEMLVGAGIGVAMGNAPQAIQSLADFVTGTNEAHGIYRALAHYHIIKESSDEKKRSV